MELRNFAKYLIVNDVPVVKSLDNGNWEFSPTGLCKFVYAWLCKNKNEAEGNCYVKIADGDRSSIQYNGDDFYLKDRISVLIYTNEKFRKKNDYINRLEDEVNKIFSTSYGANIAFGDTNNNYVYLPKRLEFHGLLGSNASFLRRFGDEFKNGTSYEDVYPNDGDKRYLPYATPIGSPHKEYKRECNGWTIKKIINGNTGDEIGLEVTINRGTPRNVRDWINIKSDILTETGFKWDLKIKSFRIYNPDLAINPDKDGIVDKLCEILGKYFHPKGGKQAQAATQPTPAPAAQQAAAQPMESREELEEALEFYELQASKGIIGADKKVTELKEKLNKLP